MFCQRSIEVASLRFSPQAFELMSPHCAHEHLSFRSKRNNSLKPRGTYREKQKGAGTPHVHLLCFARTNGGLTSNTLGLARDWHVPLEHRPRIPVHWRRIKLGQKETSEIPRGGFLKVWLLITELHHKAPGHLDNNSGTHLTWCLKKRGQRP
jgi:hypothetical protein